MSPAGGQSDVTLLTMDKAIFDMIKSGAFPGALKAQEEERRKDKQALLEVGSPFARARHRHANSPTFQTVGPSTCLCVLIASVPQ